MLPGCADEQLQLAVAAEVGGAHEGAPTVLRGRERRGQRRRAGGGESPKRDDVMETREVDDRHAGAALCARHSAARALRDEGARGAEAGQQKETNAGRCSHIFNLFVGEAGIEQELDAREVPTLHRLVQKRLPILSREMESRW